MNRNCLKGMAHVFGDNINTDLISPACYMDKSREIIAEHAMEGVDPEFSQRIMTGDFVVAGTNFGSGSSRETAPRALKDCGVSAVIAVFFARIFYRNCINIGLPALVCPDAEKIGDQDELIVDIENGMIHDETSGLDLKCDAYPPNIQHIIECGGLLESMKEELNLASLQCKEQGKN